MSSNNWPTVNEREAPPAEVPSDMKNGLESGSVAVAKAFWLRYGVEASKYTTRQSLGRFFADCQADLFMNPLVFDAELYTECTKNGRTDPRRHFRQVLYALRVDGKVLKVFNGGTQIQWLRVPQRGASYEYKVRGNRMITVPLDHIRSGAGAVVLKGAGFSCKQLKEGGFTGKELVESKSFSTSELLQIHGGTLVINHQFVGGDPSCKVGQVVFAEGKVGVITDTVGNNCCKISYSDGSRNKDMTFWGGYLRFANYPGNSNPVERVWALEEEDDDEEYEEVEEYSLGDGTKIFVDGEDEVMMLG
jgi:hypothetical protein